MKFDIVFSNPPYNKSLDIKLLVAVVDVSQELVIVHPSVWALDKKRKYKLFNTFRDKTNGHFKSVKLFDGNPIFNINMPVPLTITHIDMSRTSYLDADYFDDEYRVTDINDVSKFGSSWVDTVKPFKGKILEWISKPKNKCVWDMKVDPTKPNDNKFYCQIANIKSHHDHTITNKKKSDHYGYKKDTLKNTYEFDTEDETLNFIDYLQTDFARFCLSIYKVNHNNHVGEFEIVPYLDFTEKWDDEKLFKYFKVNSKTKKYIKNFIPDSHNLRT